MKSKVQLKVAKRKFIDELLVQNSTAEQRRLYWVDLGYSNQQAWNYITQCNKIYDKESQEVVSSIYTKDKILALLEDTLNRTRGTNERVYVDTIKTITQIKNIGNVADTINNITVNIKDLTSNAN